MYCMPHDVMHTVAWSMHTAPSVPTAFLGKGPVKLKRSGMRACHKRVLRRCADPRILWFTNSDQGTHRPVWTCFMFSFLGEVWTLDWL